MDWTESNSYLKGISNHIKALPNPIRIASFDLDDTLIHRPVRRTKTIDNKWKLLDMGIVDRIAELCKQDYIIIIFSNQSGMSRGKNFDKPQWRKAMGDLIKILTSKVKGQKYYAAVYVAKAFDLHRKPNIGLWDLMKDDLRTEFGLGKLRISNRSFYCGDAAGRPKPSPFRLKLHPSATTGDFSDTDHKFALNIGIRFLTPEQFYHQNEEPFTFKLTGFNPELFVESMKAAPISKYIFKPRSKELIIMVGQPGAGKTAFVHKYILPEGYVHINRDTCKTQNACIAKATLAMDEKESIVIDNTNPDIKSRFDYISIARERGYKHIRAIVIQIDLALAKHLNNVRHVYSKGLIPRVNNIAYNTLKKRYIKPGTYEHFDRIENVDFEFDPLMLDDPQWRAVFMRWSES